MPGVRGKPLHLESNTDLWAPIVFAPTFGSLFVAVPLTADTGSWWSTLGLVLLFGGFFTLAGALAAVRGLPELRRRGAWVPPGVARQPVLVSIVLVLLIMTVGVAYALTAFWVMELAMAAGLRGLLAGLLSPVVFFSLVGVTGFVLWRWARKFPTSKGNGTTEPGPPAERPPA
jgi:hypothetical protein